MAIDWSDTIVLARLSDEPMLSDELGGLIDRIQPLRGGQNTQGADQPPHVVVDFSGVSYINSSNIAQLLRLKRELDASGRQLRLCALSDEVWSVMMVTGLEKVFTFAPDTLTALAGLQLDDPSVAAEFDDGDAEP